LGAVASGRGIVVGLGLPVILLVAAKGNASHSHPNVAGYAIFGLTITAWSTYGVGLVAAREAGVLKRWWATPLPRWCYFVGSIVATAVVAVLAGAITVAAAVIFYGSHFDQGSAVNLSAMAALAILVAFLLGALAWAGAATTVTRAIPTVESAFPVLILVYFPVIIVSGALFRISEPSWLSTLATYLPAQPLIDAVTRAVQHTAGAPFLPTHDVIVLACWAVGSLVAAVLLFRWEPHRPTQRRPARASHGGRS
jgi:ABC-2 type transport system permease protein